MFLLPRPTAGPKAFGSVVTFTTADTSSKYSNCNYIVAMAAGDAGAAAAAAAAAGIDLGALLAGGDPSGESINNLEAELKDLKARKKAAAKELKLEKQKKDRLMTKAKALSVTDLGKVLGMKIAQAKAKAEAKAKAKAKAKAGAGPMVAAAVAGEGESEADDGEDGGR